MEDEELNVTGWGKRNYAERMKTNRDKSIDMIEGGLMPLTS